MKPHLFFGPTVVWAIISIGSNSANAQSTSLEVPLSTGSADVTAGSGMSLVPWEKIPVTLTSTMRRMEKILAGGGPPLEPQMTANDLVTRLQAYGLPVVLDETAIDDELDGDTVIQFELPDCALGLRLELALAKRGACIQLYHDHAKIISRDNMGDPEYFVTLTYDISSIAAREDQTAFANTIRQSVDIDGWTQTGTGDQTMAFAIFGGRNLLTISAPWNSHVHVRQLMAQLTTLINNNNLPGRVASRQTPIRQRSRLAASTPVALPGQNQNEKYPAFQFNQPPANRSGGMGDQGLGGGAFTVPGG